MKVAVVTGAAGGIGRAVVATLLDAGLAVVAGDVAPLDALADAHPGAALTTVPLDVTDRASVERAAERAMDRHGRVDALVNNAGVFARTPALDPDDEPLRRVLAVNLEGALRATSVFGRRIAASGGGRIVYVASISGLTGAAFGSAYAASKAGLIAAARSQARELAGQAITVNVVAPGFCDTEMLGADRPLVERFTVPRVPARRLGRPAEVAEVVRFLVCCETQYLTGAVVPLDGGLSVG